MRMNNPIKIGFSGFRHGHIFSLYELCQSRDDILVYGSSEEDPEARASAEKKGISITYHEHRALLDSPGCDVVAIGAAFGARGRIAIEALARGKHVISDKPLCTRSDELTQIQQLASQSGLKVGCMLSQRDLPCTIGARKLIKDGALGEIHAIHFNGQHPLKLQSRPKWYFEPGLHGGTINDIAIHAMDFIPWVTGLEFQTANAARCWNALAKEYPHFEDGGQMMLAMTNGAGVLGDVSYFASDGMAYKSPYYWRTTYFGEDGILEAGKNLDSCYLLLKNEKAITKIPLPAPRNGSYLDAFLNDIRGEATPDDISTESVIRASSRALLVQKAADERLHDVPL